LNEVPRGYVSINSLNFVFQVPIEGGKADLRMIADRHVFLPTTRFGTPTRLEE
jgi:hypothetical protein